VFLSTSKFDLERVQCLEFCGLCWSFKTAVCLLGKLYPVR